MMVIVFVGMDIGNVNFNNWSINGFDSICYCYGGVGKSFCIEDDIIIDKFYFVKFIYDFFFMVILKIMDSDCSKFLL